MVIEDIEIEVATAYDNCRTHGDIKSWIRRAIIAERKLIKEEQINQTDKEDICSFCQLQPGVHYFGCSIKG